jgi:hypothetical protein
MRNFGLRVISRINANRNRDSFEAKTGRDGCEFALVKEKDGLNAERTAAAAGRFHLWIVELKSGTLKAFHVIHFRAIQI